MSTQLIWQLVNKHNSFKRKNETGNRVILSAEPGNLANRHSYKHSGLANDKTVDLQPADKDGVAITVSRPKNANKPSSSRHSYTTKKNARRAASSVAKEINKTRPDLKRAAQARLGAIARAQRKQKATAKSS